MFPLILLFSSTLGANSNRQGADFNSNDGGGDEGIFLSFFPFLTNKIKAWHLCMTANLQTSFLIRFFCPPLPSPPSSPSLFYSPWSASECTPLSFQFCINLFPLWSHVNQRILSLGERAPLNRKEVQVILFSPVVANSNLIWIQLCMLFCLLWWIIFLKRSCPSPPVSTFTFFLLPLLGEAWVLTHVVLTAEICSSVARRKSLPRFFFFLLLTPCSSAW